MSTALKRMLGPGTLGTLGLSLILTSAARAQDVPPQPTSGQPPAVSSQSNDVASTVKDKGDDFDKHGPHKGHRPPPPGIHSFLDLHGIQLTAAQKSKIHGILKANRPQPAEVLAFHEAIRAVRAALLAPKVDSNAVNAAVENLAKLEMRKNQRIIQTDQEIHDVLTPAQLKQITDREAKRDAEQKQHDAAGPGHPHGEGPDEGPGPDAPDGPDEPGK